jgi:hypothetical protein
MTPQQPAHARCSNQQSNLALDDKSANPPFVSIAKGVFIFLGGEENGLFYCREWKD